MVFERAGKEAEVHDARGRGETKSVGRDQALVAVGALHEFVTESGAPLRSVLGCLRNCLQMQAAGVIASNLDRESIVEAECRTEGQMKAALVLGFHAIVNS